MSEMMACEKMHARIPVTTCVGRQTKGILMKGDAGRVFSLIPVECRDCEAGSAVLDGTPPGTTATSLTGPGGSGSRTTEKKEKLMSKKGQCANCKRELHIIGNNCCFVCYKAGKGLAGEEKAAALAAVKEKIESGEVGKGKYKVTHRGKPNKPWIVDAPPDTTAPKPSASFFPKSASMQIQEGAPVEIPVTIRLTIEIGVRFAGVSA